MKYFHFHDWTGEELAAAARIPPRQRFVIPRVCVCVGHTEGREGVTKEREKPDPVVERWNRERESETISLFFSPAVYISLSLSLWQSQDGRSPRVRDAPRVN